MFAKIFGLLCLTLVIGSQAQLTSRCDFSIMWGMYTCRLDNMLVDTENDFVNLNGTHMEGWTDEDVMRVTFQHGRMSTAFPLMVYDRFPNFDMAFITGNLQVQRFALARCERLRIFSFEGPNNAIVRLQNGMFTNCFNLDEITIHRSQVTSIEANVFVDTPNVRRLFLARNSILSLPVGLFSPLTMLEHLDIERNSIVTFDPATFQGLTSLRHIQCGQLQNRIWPGSLFSNLPSLESIDINWSGLQTILPGAFSNLPNLQTIRIYGELRRLNANIFANALPNLHTLNINRNQIDAVERGFFDNLPALRTVTATFNLCINQDLNDVSNRQTILDAFEFCFSRF